MHRDGFSIQVVRHIVYMALDEIGVLAEDIDDIAVAMTEACTNIVKHSGPADEYEVSVTVEGAQCVIRVVDTGRGFDSTSLGRVAADGAAEQGRGIHLMRSLVDVVQFTSKPEAGTIVYLEKTLGYRDGSLVATGSGQ